MRAVYIKSNSRSGLNQCVDNIISISPRASRLWIHSFIYGNCRFLNTASYTCRRTNSSRNQASITNDLLTRTLKIGQFVTRNFGPTKNIQHDGLIFGNLRESSGIFGRRDRELRNQTSITTSQLLTGMVGAVSYDEKGCSSQVQTNRRIRINNSHSMSPCY